MKITTLIPPQYRMAALLLSVAAVAVLSAGAGGVAAWKSATWRAESACEIRIAGEQKVLKEKDREIGELKAKIAEQSAAVDGLKRETDAAMQAQLEANLRAAGEARASQARVSELKAQLLDGSTTGQIMRSYWEMSR